ncbi:RDD family protein [Flavobacterium panacagri]|uniref:RDD family protein n=1 Tax=Flavobacterium panacagri TaxID=3034146 RepID=UPI0025A63C2A|nr:RDD family protein [Flavobacterium panacagri]
MKKIILGLSLLFSLLGILRSFFFVFYDFDEVTEFSNFFVFSIQPYTFAGMNIYIPRHLINGESESGTISMGLINLSFFLTFLSGTVIYYFSNYKETKLLAFNYSLVFLDSLIKIFFFIFLFNIDKLNITEFLYILITLLYLFISFYFIKKELNSNMLEKDNQTTGNDLENASNSKRFLNLLIDSFIIIVIVFGFISFAERNEKMASLLGYFKMTFGDKFASLVFFSMIKFSYYLVFESIFKSTPAKFITSCYITDEEGNPPNFSMTFKRTLLRFVPFETFSFLLGKNLHDDYSDTYVINKNTDRKIEDRYTQFLTIALGIVIVIYFFMSNRHTY